MIDGIEGAAHVEQDQDTGMPATAGTIRVWKSITAVSVEWCARYADSRNGIRLYVSTCSLKRTATTRSMVFGRKLSLEMGR